MKTFKQKISAPRLFVGIAHCLGIALLGFYLFDEERNGSSRSGMGLRMITSLKQNRFQ